MVESIVDIEVINKKTDKLIVKYENKEKGYGTRCKVCNH